MGIIRTSVVDNKAVTLQPQKHFSPPSVKIQLYLHGGHTVGTYDLRNYRSGLNVLFASLELTYLFICGLINDASILSYLLSRKLGRQASNQFEMM